MVTCCQSLYSARDLREEVEFQRKARVSDGAGGYTESWAAVSGAPTRAKVTALSGRERWASQRVEALSSWRIVVRYFSGLLESDRVSIRGKAYNIRFINNVDLADKWLVIDLDGGVAT